MTDRIGWGNTEVDEDVKDDDDWDGPVNRPHLTGGISVLKFIYTGIFIQTKLCCTGKLVKTSISYICKIGFLFLFT